MEASDYLPLSAFSSFQVRKIVKEAYTDGNSGGVTLFHGTFARTIFGDGSTEGREGENIFSTAADNHLQLYDNARFGNNLDTFMQYLHFSNGKPLTLTALQWLWPRKEQDLLLGAPSDAYIVIGDAEGSIGVISLAFRKEFVRLKDVSSKPISHLFVDDDYPHVVLAIADKCGYAVNIREQKKWGPIPELKGASVIKQVNGEYYVGYNNGEIRKAGMQELMGVVQKGSAENVPEIATHKIGRFECRVVDIILVEDDLIVRTDDGTLFFNTITADRKVQEKKRCRLTTASRQYTCGLSLSPCRRVIATGSNDGRVLLFTRSGTSLCKLDYRRSTSYLTSVAFDRKGRSILATSANGFVWRWDYVDTFSTSEKDDTKEDGKVDSKRNREADPEEVEPEENTKKADEEAEAKKPVVNGRKGVSKRGKR